MSFPVLAQARDGLNKAYIALQNWNTNPANIPLPNIVNTKRPQLNNKQIAGRYLNSVESNPSIDINKIPKMKSRDRIDHELPIADVPRADGSKKRSAACNRSEYVWPHPECQEGYFDEYKALMEDGRWWEVGACPVSFELIGSGDPSCICIRELPQFVICSDQYLEGTLFNMRGWPQKILEYRNVSGLGTDYDPVGPCARWGGSICPEPATTPEEINVQIDETIETNPATVVYLTPSQLEGYLAWRKTNGTLDDFQYIRVSDKTTAKPTSVPAIKNWLPWVALGVGTLTAVGLGVAAFKDNARRISRLRTIVATTSAPAHNAPTLRTASPSSMGSVSTTLPQMLGTNNASPAPTTSSGAPSAAPSKSYSSVDSIDDIALDIPPAGQEDAI